MQTDTSSTTTTGAPPTAPPEYVFRPRTASQNTATWQLIGGIALFVVAIVGFVVSVTSQTGQFAMQGMTTVPILIGIRLIISARSAQRAAREVWVGPYGLRVVTLKGTNTHPWESLGWSRVAKNSWSQKRELTLFGNDGKPFLTLDQTLDNFDYLVQTVSHNIGLRGSDVTDKIRMTKARRTAVGMAFGSVFLLAIAIANLVMAHSSQDAERLLKTTGVTGTATITRRFLAPNGVTPRVEYTITTADGRTGTGNVQVEKYYWDALANATTVPVLYTPTDPNNSHLRVGEVKDQTDTDPGMMYVLSIFLMVVCVVFLVSAVLTWRGWDIDFNQSTGKLYIKRFGGT